MTEKDYKRKLAAIVSSDVKGYSRLMGEDEETTVETITAHRKIFAEIMRQHHGRIVDAVGDNVLAEFASVVDALRGARDVQQALAQSNAKLPENRRMQFRIGINIGDVIEDGGQLYGDGVNVAARLESLAEPGGILISGTAYDQVKDKLPYAFEYIGEKRVKNINNPVRAYRVGGEPPPSPEHNGENVGASKNPGFALFLIVGLVVIAGIGSYFGVTKFGGRLPDRQSQPPNSSQTMSPRASIAVLPFRNLSGDKEQEYFNDGITNDLINALSKFKQLLVIASNTVFTYKGKLMKIEDVGRQLGVRYVLDGSVQKSGSNVRVNVQLNDAATGFHIWSEHYDRRLDDLFAVQDEIVHAIVGKLAVKIDAAERSRAMQKRPEDMQAYDYLLRGLEYRRLRTRSGNSQARQMFEKAIELDPGYAQAYLGLGHYYRSQAEYGWTGFPQQALQRAEELALKALSLDESLAGAYTLLGNVHAYFQRYDLAITQLDQAIALNPNDASSFYIRGQVLLWSGRVDEAIHSLETAWRFNPNVHTGMPMFLGLGYFLKGENEKAINVLENGQIRNPDWVGNYIALASVYGESGRMEDARRMAQEVLRRDPFFEIKNYGTVFKNRADWEKIVQGLRKAGLK